jgi:hypothetical protein
MEPKMRIWRLPPNGVIVQLKHFKFCYLHYAMLLQLQKEAPNAVVEIEAPVRTYIPIHTLDLENYRELSVLNV